MAPLPCLSVPAASPHLSVPGQSRRRLAGFRASRQADERGSTTGTVKRPPTASKRSSLQSPPERPIYLPRYWPTDWAASRCPPPASTFQTTLQTRFIVHSAPHHTTATHRHTVPTRTPPHTH